MNIHYFNLYWYDDARGRTHGELKALDALDFRSIIRLEHLSRRKSNNKKSGTSRNNPLSAVPLARALWGLHTIGDMWLYNQHSFQNAWTNYEYRLLRMGRDMYNHRDLKLSLGFFLQNYGAWRKYSNSRSMSVQEVLSGSIQISLKDF